MEESSKGQYFDAVTIVAPAHPDERCTLAAGSSFLVDLTHWKKPRVMLVSESLRQTDVLFELPKRPSDGQAVDLATVRARYEDGGQALTWVSASARGSLVLETRSGKPFVTVDATFESPMVGTGTRKYSVEMELTRATRTVPPVSPTSTQLEEPPPQSPTDAG